MPRPSRLLFLGFGFCANGFFYNCQEQKMAISFSASYRNNNKKNLLQQKNITPIFFNDDKLKTAMMDADGWVVSIPPHHPIADDDVFARHGDTIATIAKEKFILYLSTTGVYGDHQGQWVDETTAPAPTMARTKKRLRAEAAWRAMGAVALRLGGIYGRRRDNIGQETFHSIINGQAKRIEKPGQVFGRIHVDDIARAMSLWWQNLPEKNWRGEIFNLVDDLPANPREVFDFAYQLLGRPMPPLITYETAKNSLSLMALSFYQDNKKVKNDKIKKQWGLQLQYPTYREGLKAIWQTDYQTKK